MTQYGWTVVQHSGFGYSGKPNFENATETRGIQTKVELNMIKKHGGLVFETYMAAENFSSAANYPEGTEGIIPQAKGTFSERTIDGLRIYIPVTEVKG